MMLSRGTLLKEVSWPNGESLKTGDKLLSMQIVLFDSQVGAVPWIEAKFIDGECYYNLAFVDSFRVLGEDNDERNTIPGEARR
jgi:hypothetical protein